jgi:transketolase
MKNDIAMRDAFGKALINFGKEYQEMTVLDADVSSSTKTVLFGNEYPDRFFNLGAAEGSMVSIAGGMATHGILPVVSTFAVFLTLKGAEQIRNVVCYNRLHVVFAGGYGGLSDSFDGATHQSVEDIAVMRSLPNMNVLVAPDTSSVEPLLKSALELNEPVYLRLCRNPLPALQVDDRFPFSEKTWKVASGKDITILVCGVPCYMALEAGNHLANHGISSDIFVISSLKPFYDQEIIASIEKTKRVLTIEEHGIIGGLRSALLESCPTSLSFELDSIAINDVYGETGPYDELLEKHGLTVKNIINKSTKLVQHE